MCTEFPMTTADRIEWENRKKELCLWAFLAVMKLFARIRLQWVYVETTSVFPHAKNKSTGVQLEGNSQTESGGGDSPACFQHLG